MRAFLLAMLGTLGWGCQYTLVDAPPVAVSAPPPSAPFPPPLITFDHMGSTTVGDITYRYAQFRMINLSRAPIYYCGFENDPSYEVAVRSGDVWTSRPVWRCGFGQTHEIPVGGIETFQVPDSRWSGDAMRACVYFAADRAGRGEIKVWSDVAPVQP